MDLTPIQLDRVSVAFGDRRVLADVSLTLTEQRIGVIGLNGSGKSTLARLLNGLVRPTYGHVKIGGLDTIKDTKKVRRNVGFVFQNPANQIIMPTVSEDLVFGLKNLGIPKNQRLDQATATLRELGIERLLERETHALSGGEQQMIALASVLTMSPETIILDEPTTMLDLLNRRLLRAEIAKLRQRTVLVTHDLELIEDCERVLVVHQGRIYADAGPREAVGAYLELCEV